MATEAQLAALTAIGRQSVAYYRAGTLGTIAPAHRGVLDRIAAQSRQSVAAYYDQGAAAVPDVPSNVVVATVNATTQTVTWDDVATETGYKIFRHTANDSGAALQVATVGQNVTSTLITGLTPSTTYYYWVKATNAEGDSAFSTVDSSATSAVPTPDQPLGDYLGYFRINPGAYNTKFVKKDLLIADHPTSTKLFVACSGVGLASFGAGSGWGGYVGELTLPDFGTLSPSHTVPQSPFSGALTSMTDHLTEYGALLDSLSINRSNGINIYGLNYNATSGKLYASYNQVYHVNETEMHPAISEVNTSTFARTGNYLTPTTAMNGKGSSGNGPMISLAGTGLSSKGDFLTTPSWIGTTFGPRWYFGAADFGAETLVLSDAYACASSTPWPNGPSVRCKSGAGVVDGSYYIFPANIGSADYWYGHADGLKTPELTWGAGPTNWTPDVMQPDKGWHYHPYRAGIIRVATSQMIEVANGTRQPHLVDYEIFDVTSVMRRRVTQDFGTGVNGSTPVSGGTSYGCNINFSLLKKNGYWLLVEVDGDYGSTFAYGSPIIHVFEGDN